MSGEPPCTIVCADARDFLRAAADNTFDATIFDPPYEHALHAAKARSRYVRTDGQRMQEALAFDSIDALRPQIVGDLVRTCAGWLIAFCTPEGIAPWRDALAGAGARYKRALFWVKPDSAPQFNGQGPAMAVECMVSVWCGAGYSSWNGGGSRNYFIENCKGPERDGAHPTEKPVALMRRLVSLFSQPGALVCDPFLGTGATALACALEARRFSGCDLSADYCDVARRRVAAHGQSRMDAITLRRKGIEAPAAGLPLFGGAA